MKGGPIIHGGIGPLDFLAAEEPVASHLPDREGNLAVELSCGCEARWSASQVRQGDGPTECLGRCQWLQGQPFKDREEKVARGLELKAAGRSRAEIAADLGVSTSWVNKNVGKVTLECQNCRKSFKAPRSDAKFCSERCRWAVNKRRQRAVSSR